MPDLRTHCRISKERTGDEFRELHEWRRGSNTDWEDYADLHGFFNEGWCR